MPSPRHVGRDHNEKRTVDAPAAAGKNSGLERALIIEEPFMFADSAA
jgi:hypothetical protein